MSFDGFPGGGAYFPDEDEEDQLYFEKRLPPYRLGRMTLEKEFRVGPIRFRVEAYRSGDWRDLLLFILWYRGTISLVPVLRDDVPKLDDRLHESLYGELKATERDAAPLVALWNEEIPPIVEAFFNAPGRS